LSDGPGQVKKYLGQGPVSPLFTAGQKYAPVGSGPSSTIFNNNNVDFTTIPFIESCVIC